MYIEDKLYSVTLTEEELKLFSEFCESLYTRYDETDQVKRMKDSDILAERKRSNGGLWAKDAARAGVGAGLGAAAGAGLALLKRKNVVKAAKLGAAAGGVLGGAASMASTSKQKSDNNFYNDRLDYAQRHALRRERSDWKNNNLNREGYTY